MATILDSFNLKTIKQNRNQQSNLWNWSKSHFLCCNKGMWHRFIRIACSQIYLQNALKIETIILSFVNLLIGWKIQNNLKKKVCIVTGSHSLIWNPWGQMYIRIQNFREAIKCIYYILHNIASQVWATTYTQICLYFCETCKQSSYVKWNTDYIVSH